MGRWSERLVLAKVSQMEEMGSHNTFHLRVFFVCRVPSDPDYAGVFIIELIRNAFY